MYKTEGKLVNRYQITSPPVFVAALCLFGVISGFGTLNKRLINSSCLIP